MLINVAVDIVYKSLTYLLGG